MSFPVDLVSFLVTVFRGAQLASQSLMIGGIVFLLGLVRPLAGRLGPDAAALLAATRRCTYRAALLLAVVAALATGLQIFNLSAGLGLSVGEAMGADFVRWSALMFLSALLAAIVAGHPRAPLPLLAVFAVTAVVASVMSSHAAARLDHRGLFMLADFLHQAGAGAWIGGIPFLLLGLHVVKQAPERYLMGSRFSHIAMAAVASLACGAATLGIGYTQILPALVGTAYGAMMAAKALLLGVLLLLGLMNMLAVRSLAQGGDPPLLRLRRFAEVEIGIGLALMFIAASLASQPPAIDQMSDPSAVASPAEIAQRMTPQWPRLTSPPQDQIAIPDTPFAPAANGAADLAWSEFNHHWSGIIVVLIGLMSLFERSTGRRWPRHWPLLFLGLAVLLLVRSDPETWPIGPIPFFARLGDPEVMQHRMLTLLIGCFAVFEWTVRTGRITDRWARLAFPLLCALGGTLLLTHSHSLTDIKQRYLIELTHIPMGVLGILAGWARWLELRAEGTPARIAGWVWPICFVLIGLLLVNYREG